MVRLAILDDRLQQNAHALFQTWRRSHPSGLFLNINVTQTLVHSSPCLHFGGTDWERGGGWGSLTKHPKVLGGSVADLRKWGAEHKLAARECSDCMNGPRTPADPQDGFRLLEQGVAVATNDEFPTGPSPRAATTVQRIIRDTQLAASVKRLHSFRCQICGERIELPDGRFYAEAHHIRPLGSPYDGPDHIENILCVCPNHHVALDYRCFRIVKRSLRTRPEHRVSDEYIAYHNSKLCTRGLAGDVKPHSKPC